MTLQEWLVNECNCHDVRPVRVTIGEQSWEGCYYKQTLEYQIGMDAVSRGDKKAGDKYTEEAIYVIGKLPKVKYNKRGKVDLDAKVCFPLNGVDWYVSGYMLEENFKPENRQFHPFGVSFILRPWNIPNEAIDKYEQKKYLRIPLILG